ncbi:MAG: radical SAM protein [Caldilineaceae bacterium]|nr:radical SAM protein [Caldilineaceae bacterium]
MNVVLISTYELGRQPFGLASPAAWLRELGAQVTCLDLAIQRLDEAAIAAAGLVAIHVPMHTATRIAAHVLPRVRQLNPQAHLCCYGLYAPLNAAYLRSLGSRTILGGEFEQGLADLYTRLAQAPESTTLPQPEPLISTARQPFHVPDRSDLPPLHRYAKLYLDDAPRVTGYTEASRGCKHLCRHCPIVPVYQGRFRIVPREVVLEDIRRQVRAGAQHITFGDPDFFNGPGHALALVQALHAEFPALSYDVTIKVEHLVKQARHLPTLRDTGCVLITTAVEALDPQVLAYLDKGHTRADFEKAVALCRLHGLALNPTFVTFTPWTSPTAYADLLDTIERLDLVEYVTPIQYAIRLLIPAGSRLLELPEVQAMVGPFEQATLTYPWQHPDPRVDDLYAAVRRAVQAGQEQGQNRQDIFAAIRQLAYQAAGRPIPGDWLRRQLGGRRAKAIPYLSEPWYC